MNESDTTHLTEKFIIYQLTTYANNVQMIFDNLQPKHFQNETYREVYKVALDLHKQGIEVATALIDRTKHSLGYSWLTDILEDPYYIIDRTDDKKIESAIKHVKAEYIKNILIYNGENIEKLREVLNETYVNEGQIVSQDNINSVIEELIVKNNETIPYPFALLNRNIGGIRKKEYTIIAARPSVGKSAFLEQIFWHSIEKGKKSLFISLEMSQDAIFKRHISRLTGINLFTDIVTIEDKTKAYNEIKENLGDNQIAVGVFTLSDIENMIKKYEPDIVLIDYLQLVAVNNSRWSDYERTTYITKGLAHLRNKYNIALVVASQYSRIQYKQPTLSDLRSSGQIEQDADIVLSLWKGDDLLDEKKIHIDCLKNRNGRTFGNSDNYDVSLRFHPETMTFLEDKFKL